MSAWVHSICERCWFDGPGQHPDGGFRIPTRVKGDDGSLCCFCGHVSIAGIYLRKDPTELMCQGEHENPTWSPVVRLGPPSAPGEKA